MTPHLTETQLFDLLEQPSEPRQHLALHLAACASCREEFESLQSALGHFQAAVTQLAATPAPVALPARRQPKTRFHLIAGNAWALSFATAAVLAGLALPLVHHPASAVKPVAGVQTHSQQDDDALLESIDRDLAAPVASPLAPLTLETANGSQVHTRN